MVDVHAHCRYSLQTLHVTEAETLSSNGIHYLQIYTNLPTKNKTLPISQLGSLLNECRNSHNNKHAATG